MKLLLFFISHWMLSGFAQTFFLHRYGSHRMFTMRKRWERFFYLFTFITQGASYLNPRAYAVLHRMHHAYTDTEQDPHSPAFSKNVFSMMLHTYKVYSDILYRKNDTGSEFDQNVPEWEPFDRFVAKNRWIPLGFVLVYLIIYLKLATRLWHWLLFPVTVVMGPVHGAIVNWCGHKYGYRNYDNDDQSTNALTVDFLTLGELYQNNHHNSPGNPNLARKADEFDIAYPLIRMFEKVGIIAFADYS